MFHPEGPTLFELARQALSSTEGGYDLLAPKFDHTPFRTPDSLLAAAAPYVGAPGSLGSALDLCCGTGAAMGVLRPLCRERVIGVDFSLGMLAQARRALAPQEPSLRLDSWPNPSFPGPDALRASAPGFEPSVSAGVAVPNRLLAASEGTAKLDFVRADVLDLAFGAGGSFDLVTCFGALGHVVGRDQHRLLEVVVRALRPGGCFIFPSAERPRPWSPRLWLSLAFNAVMAVRNSVLRPPFVMYYLSFLLPRARRMLKEHGFEVEIHRGVDPEHLWVDLVVATRSRKIRNRSR